ncbi:MAG: PAS domain S-box protein [Syntrophales bacterium]
MQKLSKDIAMVFQEDPELFIKLISVMPDAVLLTDMQGKIIFMNDIGIELLGYSSAENLIGKDALSLISPQHYKKAEKNLARLIKGLPRLLKGDVNPNEYTVIAEDGSHITVEIYGNILRNADESLFLMVHVCRDITERKRAEEDIVKSEQRYRAILDKSPDPVIIRNKDGIIVDANIQATEFFGYSKKELIGHHVTEMYSSEELERVIKAMKRANRYGKAHVEVNLLRKDGQEIRVDVSASCFTVGSEVLYKIIYRDETEQRKIQEQLKKAKVELESQIVERTLELMEANTALKVLMSNREKEKSENEEKLLTNLREQVLPYIHDIMKDPLGKRQKDDLKMLEENLQNIMSEFRTHVQSNVLKFTPKEIQVATLIKEGMKTKEIAKMMNVSTKTVDIFRYNIRMKLGLNNQRANLKSHLLSV